MSEDHRPYGQDSTSSWAQRHATSLAISGLLLAIGGVIIGLAATTPKALAENVPPWAVLATSVVDGIISFLAGLPNWIGWIIAVFGVTIFLSTTPWTLSGRRYRRRSIPAPEVSRAARFAPVAASVPEAAPASLAEEPPEEREVIDIDLEYVMSLRENHTSAQAEQLLAAYVGKWTKVSGSILDVHSGGRFFTRIRFEDEPSGIPFTSFPSVHADFNDATKFDRLSLLRRGGIIPIARGQAV